MEELSERVMERLDSCIALVDSGRSSFQGLMPGISVALSLKVLVRVLTD